MNRFVITCGLYTVTVNSKMPCCKLKAALIIYQMCTKFTNKCMFEEKEVKRKKKSIRN